MRLALLRRRREFAQPGVSAHAFRKTRIKRRVGALRLAHEEFPIVERFLPAHAASGSGTPAREGRLLPLDKRRHVEIGDLFLEQLVEIEPRAQPDQRAAKPDGGAIHEHEFARRLDAADAFQFRMNFVRLPHAVFRGGHAVIHSAARDRRAAD